MIYLLNVINIKKIYNPVKKKILNNEIHISYLIEIIV